MLILLFAVLLNVHAERPVPARDGVYSAGAEFNYFHTSSNYQLEGTSHDLFSGASLDNMDLRASFAYEMWKRVRVFSSLDYSQTHATDGVISKSNGGLNEIGLGAQYWLNLPQASLVPQLQIRHPFWTINEDTDHALIGDGVNVFELGAYAIGRFRRWHPFAYLGYEKRDAGKASLMPYAVGLNWRPTQLWVEAQYRGYTPVTRDSDSDNRLLRDVFVSKISGGSYRFDPVNPTLNEAVLQIGYRLGHGWNVYAGYDQTVNGNSSANGWTATAGFLLTARMHARRSEVPEQDDSHETKFQPEAEKYDESLFRDDDNSKARPRARKSPSVDKLLNETEKELNDDN